MSGGETQERPDSAAGTPAARSSLAFLLPILPAQPARTLSPSGLDLGRASEPEPAEIEIDDVRVSRRHARIALEPLGWRLHDLGSRNGSFVDGTRVMPLQPVELVDGALLRFGDSLFVFHVGAPPELRGDRTAFPGRSPAAAAVRAHLERLARATGHALVLGETGTGKERVARAIGRGRGGPLIPQNCAELTRDLARSELFGHVRGAFSGALATRVGLVEQAAGGTLFLDEVGELELDVQGELLRFLEDGMYRPVGGSELRHSDARVVAATNVALDLAVREGRFRRDLLARLRAINEPLELPPLRHRRADILDWACTFLVEAGVSVADAWTCGAVESLTLYTWPDNLRELRGVVRAVAARAQTYPVEATALPGPLQEARRAARQASSYTSVSAPRAPELGSPSRDEIVGVLVETGGRMRTSAHRLGIDRRKLYRLCEQLGIDFGSYRSASDPASDD